MNEEEKRIWAIEQAVKSLNQFCPTPKMLIEFAVKLIGYVNQKPVTEDQVLQIKKEYGV